MNYTVEYDYLGDFNTKEITIFNLLVLYPHLKQKEIAAIVNMSEKTVRDIINKPKFKAALNERLSLPSKVLNDSKTEAAITLRNLMRNGNERTQLNACKMILYKELFNSSEAPEDTEINFEGFDENKS